MANNPAVILIAHGSPESAADVPAFMRNITSGRPVPPQVMQEVQHRYNLIGRSPLSDLTRKQASQLRQSLDLPVYIGMRNWTPYIADTVAQMVSDGITEVAAICLAPQNSRTSVGLYKRALLAETAEEIKVHFIESWHDHPLLIRAFKEKLLPAWENARRGAGKDVQVIFTAHSVPAKTIEDGDPYESQTRETAALVAAQLPALARNLWRFAFQSQGMSGGPGSWLGPTVEDTILALKAEGHNCVLIQPIGFLCDHVEVLYDIDVVFKRFAEDKGMQLTRTESLNESPTLTAALADLSKRTLRLP